MVNIVVVVCVAGGVSGGKISARASGCVCERPGSESLLFVNGATALQRFSIREGDRRSREEVKQV
jgi:hypothetical protein